MPKPASYTAPTELTWEMHAGQAVELQYPSLPDETKRVIPAATALAAAVVIPELAESHVEVKREPPKLVLMTLIGFAGLSFLWVMHHSQPAIIAEVLALPPVPYEILTA